MKAVFRVIAIDETEHWGGLPDECTAVYGLYLFRVGEATHVCSLSPSTRLDFLYNAFVGIERDDPFAEQYEYDNGGEATTYTAYLDPDKLPSNIRVSEGREFDDAGEHDEDEQDKARSNEWLWEQAAESFESDPPYIRVLESTDPNIRDTVTGDLFENVS